MVDLDAGEYLLNALLQIGPVVNNGMGLVAQPWTEIRAFCGDSFEEWEAVAIRRMSEAYLRGLNLTSPLAIMPMERG